MWWCGCKSGYRYVALEGRATFAGYYRYCRAGWVDLGDARARGPRFRDGRAPTGSGTEHGEHSRIPGIARARAQYPPLLRGISARRFAWRPWRFARLGTAGAEPDTRPLAGHSPGCRSGPSAGMDHGDGAGLYGFPVAFLCL